MLSDDFKNALAGWASGVAVLTASDGALAYGMTVSSVASVSLDPPLVLVCVANGSPMIELVARGRRFALNILAEGQAEVSTRFALPGRLPSAGLPAPDDALGTLDQPLIAGALGHLVCTLHANLPGGDHAILVGEVVHAASRPGAPLVYWGRDYRALALTTDPHSG